MTASRLRRRGRRKAGEQGQDSQKGEQNAYRPGYGAEHFRTFDRGARLVTGLVADEDVSDHHRSTRWPASAPIAQGINMPSEYQIATKGAPASGQWRQ